MHNEPDIPQAELNEKQWFDDIVLYAHCMAHNRPIDEFCRDCGMPIGQYVWNQPLQGILARGWAYRRATTGRVSPILFWGMWAIFGSDVLLVLIGVFAGLITLDVRPATEVTFPELAGVAISGIFSILHVMMLVCVTRNYLRHRNTEHDG